MAEASVLSGYSYISEPVPGANSNNTIMYTPWESISMITRYGSRRRSKFGAPGFGELGSTFPQLYASLYIVTYMQ